MATRSLTNIIAGLSVEMNWKKIVFTDFYSSSSSWIYGCGFNVHPDSTPTVHWNLCSVLRHYTFHIIMVVAFLLSGINAIICAVTLDNTRTNCQSNVGTNENTSAFNIEYVPDISYSNLNMLFALFLCNYFSTELPFPVFCALVLLLRLTYSATVLRHHCSSFRFRTRSWTHSTMWL